MRNLKSLVFLDALEPQVSKVLRIFKGLRDFLHIYAFLNDFLYILSIELDIYAEYIHNMQTF